MRFKEFNITEASPSGFSLSSMASSAKDYVSNLIGGNTADKSAPATSQAFSVSVPAARRGADVADLQKALVAFGYQLPKHGVDGINGPETTAAIKKFQGDNQLQATGTPDQDTVAKVNELLKSKPDIAAKLTKSTTADVKSKQSASKVDLSVIQDPNFKTKLEKVANALGIDTSVLIAIMKHESSMDPSRVNPNSNATGLIQFMPQTAIDLGTTVDELRTMSAVDQLDYVYMYYKKIGVRPGSDLGQIYMLTFLPKYAYSDDSTVLGQSGGGKLPGTNLSMDAIYKQNSGFDRNKDGVFTVADVKQSVSRFA